MSYPTYQPVPKTAPIVLAVLYVTPCHGTTAGGTAVTVKGTGFVTGAGVKFDGTSATGVSFVNSTAINCTTPAHAAGDVAVRVTNPDASYAEDAAGFAYVAPVAGYDYRTVGFGAVSYNMPGTSPTYRWGKGNLSAALALVPNKTILAILSNNIHGYEGGYNFHIGITGADAPDLDLYIELLDASNNILETIWIGSLNEGYWSLGNTGLGLTHLGGYCMTTGTATATQAQLRAVMSSNASSAIYLYNLYGLGADIWLMG
jgi:hypothetical protein